MTITKMNYDNHYQRLIIIIRIKARVSIPFNVLVYCTNLLFVFTMYMQSKSKVQLFNLILMQLEKLIAVNI